MRYPAQVGCVSGEEGGDDAEHLTSLSQPWPVSHSISLTVSCPESTVPPWPRRGAPWRLSLFRPCQYEVNAEEEINMNDTIQTDDNNESLQDFFQRTFN